MNPDMIQFQCGFCRTTLTVPAQMAGVTGPCPHCGQTVTSPMPAPVAAPVPQQWAPAPMAAQAPASPPQAWPPAPQASVMGEMQGGMQAPVSNIGLPPKRAPGQPPLSATLNAPAGQTPWSAAPGAMPSLGSLDAAGGVSGGGLPNHSRLIPGSPPLPNMQPMSGAGGMLGMPGMPAPLSGSSLLGREVSHAPASPMTRPLQALGSASLSLGGASSHAGNVAPLPGGRSIASLRAPRGTNFIRLAFAAVFLLGFLGLVAFLLKDYLPGIFPSLAGHELVEETSKNDTGLPTQDPLASNPAPTTSSKPLNNEAAEKPKPAPIVVGFDPQEPTTAKAAPAAPADLASMGAPSSSSSPSVRSALPVDSTSPAPAADTLLEVPAKPAMNPSSGAQNSSPTSLAQSHAIEENDIPSAAQPAA
ncbi:MAG: hypothetical protein JWR15_3210, partial [Prosthecobacter sp.]|nr:hypothetical protein [Prosthecobacter sp.]